MDNPYNFPAPGPFGTNAPVGMPRSSQIYIGRGGIHVKQNRARATSPKTNNINVGTATSPKVSSASSSKAPKSNTAVNHAGSNSQSVVKTSPNVRRNPAKDPGPLWFGAPERWNSAVSSSSSVGKPVIDATKQTPEPGGPRLQQSHKRKSSDDDSSQSPVGKRKISVEKAAAGLVVPTSSDVPRHNDQVRGKSTNVDKRPQDNTEKQTEVPSSSEILSREQAGQPASIPKKIEGNHLNTTKPVVVLAALKAQKTHDKTNNAVQQSTSTNNNTPTIVPQKTGVAAIQSSGAQHPAAPPQQMPIWPTLFKPEHIQGLPDFFSRNKEGWERGLRQLWAIVQSNGPETPQNQEAVGNIIDFSRKLTERLQVMWPTLQGSGISTRPNVRVEEAAAGTTQKQKVDTSAQSARENETPLITSNSSKASSVDNTGKSQPSVKYEQTSNASATIQIGPSSQLTVTTQLNMSSSAADIERLKQGIENRQAPSSKTALPRIPPAQLVVPTQPANFKSAPSNSSSQRNIAKSQQSTEKPQPTAGKFPGIAPSIQFATASQICSSEPVTPNKNDASKTGESQAVGALLTQNAHHVTHSQPSTSSSATPAKNSETNARNVQINGQVSKKNAPVPTSISRGLNSSKWAPAETKSLGETVRSQQSSKTSKASNTKAALDQNSTPHQVLPAQSPVSPSAPSNSVTASNAANSKLDRKVQSTQTTGLAIADQPLNNTTVLNKANTASSTGVLQTKTTAPAAHKTPVQQLPLPNQPILSTSRQLNGNLVQNADKTQESKETVVNTKLQPLVHHAAPTQKVQAATQLAVTHQADVPPPKSTLGSSSVKSQAAASIGARLEDSTPNRFKAQDKVAPTSQAIPTSPKPNQPTGSSALPNSRSEVNTLPLRPAAEVIKVQKSQQTAQLPTAKSPSITSSAIFQASSVTKTTKSQAEPKTQPSSQSKAQAQLVINSQQLTIATAHSETSSSSSTTKSPPKNKELVEQKPNQPAHIPTTPKRSTTSSITNETSPPATEAKTPPPKIKSSTQPSSANKPNVFTSTIPNATSTKTKPLNAIFSATSLFSNNEVLSTSQKLCQQALQIKELQQDLAKKDQETAGITKTLMFEREQHRVVLSNNEQRATSAEQAFESYKALAGRVEQGLQERVQVLEGENKTLRSENLTLRYERDMARHGLNGIKQWISQVENENTALKDKFRTRWEEHMAELTRVKAECDKRIADAEIAEKKWRIKHDEVHLSKADLTRKQSLHIEQIRAEAKQKYIQLFTELDTQGCETYAGFGSYVKSAQAMCKFMSAQITGEAVSMGVYANEVTKHDKDFARYVKEFRESLEPQDGEEPKWQAMAASTAAREAFFKELEGLTKSLGEVKGGLGTVRKGLEGKMKAEGEELEKIRKELLDLKTVRSKDQTSLKAELERKTKEHASLKKEVEHKNSLMGTRKTEIEALKASGKKLDDALRTLKAESYDLIASSQKRYETAEAKCLSQSAGLQRRDLKLAELTQKLADLSEKMEEKKREVEQLDKYLEQKNKEIAELEKGQLGTTDAFLPLTEIGILVRTRYLEKLKPYRGQNKSLIEAGDLAAHGGAPLADALLFSYTLPSIVAPRTDFHVFEQLYETCISDVEELRELVPFQEVLRWNGWMKTLRNHQLREEAERFLKMTKGLLEEGRKVGLEVWFQGAEGKKGFEECENLWVECRNEFKNESGGK